MDQLLLNDISTIHLLLKNKNVSSVELTRIALANLNSLDKKLKACVSFCEEPALAQAAEADKAIASGNIGPLTGVPAIIKDNICTSGIKTTCSSKMLENFVPPYDATVVRKLKAANAVIIAKANMDEFAMGSSTENSAFFTTRNPWDTDRVPGGSSGGSAVSVAAREAFYALGSDTGGSIRQPAGFCNVVGLKPTYGRVSRFGLVAFASSLDQIGPLTRTVTDCAYIMNAISGHDSSDSTSAESPVPDYTKGLGSDLKGMKVGVPKEYFVEGMQQEVKDNIVKAIEQIRDLGAQVDWDVSLPNTRYALAAYYIIAPSEASANLARYDGFKYGYSTIGAANIWDQMTATKMKGFGAEVKRRIMLGTYALSAGYYDAYYLKAQKIRTLIKREFEEAFKKYDALLTPTSPTVPFKIGEKTDDPLQMYLSDLCTLPINIAGVPAISIPAGFSQGLPTGLQLIGNYFEEQKLLKIAYAYEQKVDWNKKVPPACG
jgi:aspartyl-tRNA(Asn)/glutamyl-tRNA(Gln) amidotransferase subunit A